MDRDKRLSGKTILITGGSSRLGRTVAGKAMEEGAKVFLTYFQHKEPVKPLIAAGAEAFCLDLAETVSMDAFVEAFKEKSKGLDILIHNAAATSDHGISNMPEEAWERILRVNLKAPFYLTKKLLPLLVQSSGGKILMITSRAASSGAAGASNYAASKAGLAGLVKSLALELAKSGVLVNAVNPGFMNSQMTESLPREVIARNLRESLTGRFSDPDEVADFIVYLCSEATQQVSGQIFHFESRNIP